MSPDNVIGVDFGGKAPGHRCWVAPFRNPVPMLWVIPPDVMQVSAEALASSISRLDNINVWQLEGGALAFSLPDILVKWGVALDYEAYLKRTRPLFQIVDPCLISERSALDLEIPDSKYWVCISLQPEETNKRICRYFKSHLSKWDPFAFRAYSSYDMGREDLASLREYLAEWLLTAGGRSVCGESLHVGNTELSHFAAPAGPRAYSENGFEVRCSSYAPCTWPWVDLYLRMRRELPAKKRLSVRFFNETDPKARK